MTSVKKLNMFQRGILQRNAIGIAYLGSAITTAFLLDWLDKWFFIRLAESAQASGALSGEAANAFIMLIQQRDSRGIPLLFMIALICALIGWFFMRCAAKLNLSWPVLMPRVVEFRAAMEQFGIVDPDERLAFVRKNHLPVFIALKPLIGMMHENVHCRLYVFTDSSLLGSEEVFEKYTGRQALCLDAEDFDRLLEEYGPKTREAYALRVNDLEKSLADLKATHSLLSADVDRLTEENKKLQEELAAYRDRDRTLAAREKNLENRANSKIAFWRVGGPLLNRLFDEAQPNTRYTRAQIQKAFERELEAFPEKKYPELRAAIRKLLHTAHKEEARTPYDLTGWAMEALRNELGELAQKDPGRTKTG